MHRPLRSDRFLSKSEYGHCGILREEYHIRGIADYVAARVPVAGPWEALIREHLGPSRALAYGDYVAALGV